MTDFVIDTVTDGRASRRVVLSAVDAPKAVWHRGASHAVWAIRDGRDVAAAMHEWRRTRAANAKVAA